MKFIKLFFVMLFSKLTGATESVFDLNNPGPNMGIVDAKNIRDAVIETRMVGVVNDNKVIPSAIVYDVTTGAASIKIFDANAPYKFEILDVIIQPRGASTNGTIKLTDGANDITNAMVCAADKTMVRAGTIDNAYSTIAADGTLEIVCAGDSPAATIGLITIIIAKRG
jgi:hypothetical protein